MSNVRSPRSLVPCFLWITNKSKEPCAEGAAWVCLRHSTASAPVGLTTFQTLNHDAEGHKIQRTRVDADPLPLCGAPCGGLSQGAGARSQTAVGRHAGYQFAWCPSVMNCFGALSENHKRLLLDAEYRSYLAFDRDKIQNLQVRLSPTRCSWEPRRLWLPAAPPADVSVESLLSGRLWATRQLFDLLH